MQAVGHLLKQLAEYSSSLFQEGFLDEQFYKLRRLEDETNPHFVAEVVTLFFQDAERLVDEMDKALGQENIDFQRVDTPLHQLKGCSSSIGAGRVFKVCVPFKKYCEEKNVEGCLQSLQELKQEYAMVKSKLETLFKMEQQLFAAGMGSGSTSRK
ncbi:histidine-containing phosphotransfer protein 1-like [Lotus japonicus]|uniref:histidine-containing phosphotransfer protein 1-like n=1 Tax=Lotus japonicus TaxID=34305 RepID=UPI002584469F|nr:histidine-containing phosphotransfer protein 1-like [Lotus japonicus]